MMNERYIPQMQVGSNLPERRLRERGMSYPDQSSILPAQTQFKPRPPTTPPPTTTGGGSAASVLDQSGRVCG